jgi:hypothetical protein
MKPQEVRYEILCEIEDEKAQVQIGFRFEDYFETNTYYLVSETAGYPCTSNMVFDVVKDGREIGKVRLVENDVRRMLKEFYSTTQDHDLKKIIQQRHESSVEMDLVNFFENYKKTIVENKNTLTGELKRMRSVAGIK